jgi:hypothetical protein
VTRSWKGRYVVRAGLIRTDALHCAMGKTPGDVARVDAAQVMH